MIETVTLDELKAEVLSPEEIEDLNEMVIYITDETDGRPSDEEVEDECSQEEGEYKTVNSSRVSLILMKFQSIFQALLKRGLLFFRRKISLLRKNLQK